MRIWILAGCVAGMSAFGDRKAVQREDLLRRGQLAREDGLDELSEQHFARALELSREPGDRVEALLGIAEARIGRNQIPEALSSLDQAGMATPSPGQQVRMALLRAEALDDRDAAAALLVVQSALRDIPETERSKAALILAEARLHYQADRFEEALRGYEAYALRADAVIPSGFEQEWAAALLRAGRSAEAEARLRALIARTRDKKAKRSATIQLAALLSETKRSVEARALLAPLLSEDASTETDPTEVWIETARSWELEGQPVKAGEVLDQAAARTNLPPAALTYIAIAKGRMLLRTDRTEEGCQLIRGAIRSAPEHPQSAAAQLDIARHFLSKGEWESARAEYQRYLESTPETAQSIEARFGRAACLQALERYSEAAAQYEMLAAEPALAPAARIVALRGAARAWRSDAQEETARSIYHQVIAEAPDSPAAIEAEFQIAESYRATRDWAEARKRFTDFRTRHPGHELAEESLLHLALLAEDEGDRNQALSIYNEVITGSVNGRFVAQATFNQGLIHYQRGSFEEALKQFEAVAQNHKTSPYAERAIFMQAWCQSLSGRSDAGLAICKQFLLDFPNSVWIPQVELWIGETQFHRGKFSEAERTFSGLGLRRPVTDQTDDALYWAGRSAMQAKNPLKAIESFSTLIAEIPKSPLIGRTRLDQGDALRELGQFPEAILVYEEILALDKESYLTALARIRIGDCHYILAAQDPTRYERALANYREAGDLKTARTELTREAGFKIGRCLESQGDPIAAFQAFLSVLHDYSTSAATSEWVARAGLAAGTNLETRKMWREAAGVYERMIQRGGPAAADAKHRLSRIRGEQWGRF